MKLSHRYIALFGLVIVLVMAFSTVHADSIFVVTTDNYFSDGACNADCSLADAMQAANADPDLSIINFNIPGAGVHNIPIRGGNSIIIAHPVVIDGTTQPGYDGTPLIQIDGQGQPDIGIQNAFSPTNPDNSPNGITIRGLAIINYGDGGIYFDHTSDNVIELNYIGVAADGITASGNGSLGNDLFSGMGMILVDSSNNNIIRGNVISANKEVGIVIGNESDNNAVENNRIGTNAAGTAALGSQIYGIYMGGSADNVFGGTTPGARNIISGNQIGIFLGGAQPGLPTNNLVQGNYIGTTVTGTAAVGNSVVGIRVSGVGQGGPYPTQDYTIGGTDAGAGNIIAYNGLGVEVDDVSAQIAIEGNSIHSNSGLGIDLAADGVTANDAGDADSGPNNLQNFPILSDAEQADGQLVIGGHLNSTPNLTYRIEFFANHSCDVAGNGEGETYLGATNVATNGSGNASLSWVTNWNSAPGDIITATAIDPNNNTSEFSPCVGVVASTIPTPVRNYFTTDTPTLTWNAVPGALGYEIQVDSDRTFPTPYIFSDATIPADRLYAQIPSLANGTYYWRVHALLPNGNVRGWSVVESFVIAA